MAVIFTAVLLLPDQTVPLSAHAAQSGGMLGLCRSALGGGVTKKGLPAVSPDVDVTAALFFCLTDETRNMGPNLT